MMMFCRAKLNASSKRVCRMRCVNSFGVWSDRKSTRLNSSHANIYTLSLHDALPILALYIHLDDDVLPRQAECIIKARLPDAVREFFRRLVRSEEHTSELQSRQYLHSFPTRRSSYLSPLHPS